MENNVHSWQRDIWFKQTIKRIKCFSVQLVEPMWCNIWHLETVQPHFLEEAFCNVVQARVMHPFPSRCPSSGSFHYAQTMCMTKLCRWTTDLWVFFADVRSQLERSRRCFATGLQMRKRRQRVVRRLLFFSCRREWGGSGPETPAQSHSSLGHRASGSGDKEEHVN